MAVMMPAMITVIGPVGPDTWAGVPPRGAATKPSTIAPQRPAIAPAPEVTPNAIASGMATTAVVMPPARSPRQLCSTPWVQLLPERHTLPTGGSRNGERMLVGGNSCHPEIQNGNTQALRPGWAQ